MLYVVIRDKNCAVMCNPLPQKDAYDLCSHLSLVGKEDYSVRVAEQEDFPVDPGDVCQGCGGYFLMEDYIQLCGRCRI